MPAFNRWGDSYNSHTFIPVKASIYSDGLKKKKIRKDCRSSFPGFLRTGTDVLTGFPGGAVVENLTASAGDVGSNLGWGRSPREGSGNPLQHSCLGNPVDRGVCWATVHGVTRVRHHWVTQHTHRRLGREKNTLKCAIHFSRGAGVTENLKLKPHFP